MFRTWNIAVRIVSVLGNHRLGCVVDRVGVHRLFILHDLHKHVGLLQQSRWFRGVIHLLFYRAVNTAYYSKSLLNDFLSP